MTYLPDHLKMYLHKNRSNEFYNVKEYLDFIMTFLDDEERWLTVAEISTKKITVEGVDLIIDNWMFSVLISGTNVDKLLENSEWDVNPTVDLGRPYVDWERNHYHPGLIEKDGLIFQYFTIFRNYPDTSRPVTFEFMQHFLLFHNYYTKKDNLVFYHNKDGTETKIAEIILEPSKDGQQNIILNVDRLKLLEYLAATKQVLGIYFQNRRYNKRENSHILQQYEEEKKSKSVHEKHFSSELIDYTNPKNQNDFWNELIGKRIIFPPPNPRDKFLEKNEYVSFIYKVNDEGEKLEYTCEKDKLSTRFVQKENLQGQIAPMVLTPIFFRMEVLDHYLDNPEKYTVTEREFSIEGSTSLSYDKVSDEYLIAYLGDLELLPYKEQLHWRKFNVVPQGDVPDEVINRDEFAKPPASLGLIEDFKQLLKKINHRFETIYGEFLFHPLTGEDEYIPKVLFIPTSDEPKKADQFFLNLAKMTLDALNRELLKRSNNNSKENRLIFQFGNFLKSEFGVPEGNLSQYVNWLFMVSSIRSTSSAHRKGKKFEKKLEKYGLANLNKIDLCKRVIQEANEGLNAIDTLVTKKCQGKVSR